MKPTTKGIDITATQSQKSKQTGHTSAKENQNNYNYSSAPIANTPFTMWRSEKGYCITLGNSAITDYHATEKEALKEMPKGNIKGWMALISAIASNVYDYKTEQRIQEAIKQGGQ